MRNPLNRHTRESGFTMIELLVVVIIIAILAAIAVPVYIGIQNNAKKSGIQSDVATTKLNLAAVLTEDGSIGSGETFTATGKSGDATVQNSKSTADETITVTVNADNTFKVVGSSVKLDTAYAADSKNGQTTNSDVQTALGRTPTYTATITANNKFLSLGTPTQLSFVLFVNARAGWTDWSPSQPNSFTNNDALKVAGPYTILNGVYNCTDQYTNTDSTLYTPTNVKFFNAYDASGSEVTPSYAGANSYVVRTETGCTTQDSLSLSSTGTLAANPGYIGSVQYTVNGKTYVTNVN